MDDFRSSELQHTDLLRLWDHYPMRVPIKGSFVSMRAVRIIVTCVDEPKLAFLTLPDSEIVQLTRRISAVVNVELGETYDWPA